MNGALRQRILIFVFWFWVVGILGLYIGSFGPVIRILLSALLP